jgi:phosphoesterase RecJ-like protein
MKNSQMRNNTLAETADAFRRADTILFFPHSSMDGDTLGSSVALCAAARKLGKRAHVIIEEEVPETIDFLENPFCTSNLSVAGSPDLCVCVDCGELHRIQKRVELFNSGAERMCIDHHATTKPFLDWNYIDGNAAAAAELAYDIVAELKVEFDQAICEAIYTGIVTDTGRFQYSNTRRKTHVIVADLYSKGLAPSELSINIYQNVSLEKLMLESKIMATVELFSGGRVAVACMAQEMLLETGAKPEHSDGVVEKLRNIKGVEVAALLKERKDKQVKVSLRSKRFIDVASFSEERGGGGHARAAGYVAKAGLEPLKSQIASELGTLFDAGRGDAKA